MRSLAVSRQNLATLNLGCPTGLAVIRFPGFECQGRFLCKRYTDETAPLVYCRGAGERNVDRTADVRLFVPRDDGLQHHSAAYPLEVHFQPGRGQSSVRHSGVRLRDRNSDAWIHAALRRAAAALGAADDSGGDV